MLFFICLERGSLGAPPGRPWAQLVGPGRFTTANPIQSVPAGELPGHRSGDRATEAPRAGRRRCTGVKTEWQEKRFRTITTWNHIQPPPSAAGVRVTPGIFFPPRVRGRFTTEDPIQSRRGVGRNWRPYGRPGPQPRQWLRVCKTRFLLSPRGSRERSVPTSGAPRGRAGAN